MTPTNRRRALIDATVRASRDLGSDPFLVLHGGGNTSVKDGDRIWVKASGFDLGELTPDGLVEMDRTALGRMLRQGSMSDVEMMDGYRAALIDPDAPSPTIEAMVHHALPATSVLHTHADAIVTLTDTVHGVELAERALGGEVIALPYVMPGFDLARQVHAAWKEQGSERISGIVLAHHGLFTVGESPQAAYDTHIALVARAEGFIERETDLQISRPLPESTGSGAGLEAIRTELEKHATGPLELVGMRDSEVDAFMARDDFTTVSQRGPTTLEHVIRTKRVPMIDGDVAAYTAEYRDYYGRNKHRAGGETHLLDPVPRVILDPSLGLVSTGSDERSARAVQDLYRHTIRIITAAETLGGYRTIDEARAFDIEYWELEQRRLRPAGR